MHKSNTNSEKIFDNNENIKTIEKLSQVIHNSIFALLQRSYYSSISQCKKIALCSKSLENDDKVTTQVACFIYVSLPIYVLQSLQGHLSVVQNFIFYLNIPNEFALLILLGINPHILGASEDILFVLKYTVRFVVFVVLDHFSNCMVFV